MHNVLKRLELQGFKSFAGKTVLDFPARVVAIVGPNGSGKSNIIDALRWVLGEREAKKLRGDTLDTLIFAGTAKKSAVGLARVSIYFDNRKRNFPLDTEEVVLARKIDRSGTSEFTWNESEIKLKDLVPILARARLGSRGLTMVGQGQSDIFVKSTPEERRMMIEEILGLKEFRLKKHQAEQKLRASIINMDKVQAMIDELGPHLRFLRKQRTRFEKRNEVENTLKNLEDQYFSFYYHDLLKAIKGLTAPLVKLSEDQRGKEREIVTLETELKNLGKKVEILDRAQEIRDFLQSLLDRKFSVEKEIGRLEVKVEFERSASPKTLPLAELTEMVDAFLNDIESMLTWDALERVKDKLSEWAGRLRKALRADSKELRAGLTGQLSKYQEDLIKLDEEIKSLRKEDEEVIIESRRANIEFREITGSLEGKKNDLRKLEQQLQAQAFEEEKLQLKLSELEREWQSFGRQVSELKVLPESPEEPGSENAKGKMIRLRSELAAIGEIDEGLVEEAKQSEERYEFLSKESGDLNGAIADLKNLVRDLDRKIHADFKSSFRRINEEFNNYFRLMFGGGKAKLKLQAYKPQIITTEEEAEVSEETSESGEDRELRAGVEIDLSLPQKSIRGIDMLSGGEKSLVSLAALFALISVSPPPFLVLDEIDAALDEDNTRRFSELVKEFSKKTQFILVTHNKTTMEAADVLYGITMDDDGVSKVLSLKLEDAV